MQERETHFLFSPLSRKITRNLFPFWPVVSGTLWDEAHVLAGEILGDEVHVVASETLGDELHVSAGVILDAAVDVLAGVIIGNKVDMLAGGILGDELHVSAGVILGAEVDVLGGRWNTWGQFHVSAGGMEYLATKLMKSQFLESRPLTFWITCVLKIP